MEVLAPYALAKRELFTIPAPDGFAIPASVLKPASLDPSKKYPVLIHVYGGPGRADRAGPLGAGRPVRPASRLAGLRRRLVRPAERQRAEQGPRGPGRAPDDERRRARRSPDGGQVAQGPVLGGSGAVRHLGLERRRLVHAPRDDAHAGVQGRHLRRARHRLALLRFQVRRGLHEDRRGQPRGVRAHVVRQARQGPARGACSSSSGPTTTTSTRRTSGPSPTP